MKGPEFLNGQFYRLKGKGAAFDKTADLLILRVHFEVAGGELAGTPIDGDWFCNSEKARDFVYRKMLVLGVDLVKDDLTKLGEKVAGQECWGKCEIRKKEGGGYWDPRVGEIRSINDMIPGGIEAEAAKLFGNTATPPPRPAEWNENY